MQTISREEYFQYMSERTPRVDDIVKDLSIMVKTKNRS